MFKIKSSIFLLLILTLGTFSTQAQEEDLTSKEAVQVELTPEQLEYIEWEKQFNAKLDRKQGLQTIINDQVSLNIPEDYYFLNAQDTRAVLEEAWGNPEDDTVLGMIFPKKYWPNDANAWGVVLTFDNDGYVSDKNASKLDFDELLTQMKKESVESNEWRTSEGYQTVDLIGWAEPPHYDAAAHKIYWAKELSFEGMEENTLNYFVRILGRKGVLNLNFIASMSQLDEIKAATPTMLEVASFTETNTYADYQAGDKKAAYGLAALITGGAIAQKTGLIAVLLVFAKKFGIFAIAILAAAGGWFKRFFNRSK